MPTIKWPESIDIRAVQLVDQLKESWLDIILILVIGFLFYQLLKMLIERSVKLLRRDPELTQDQLSQRAETSGRVLKGVVKVVLVFIVFLLVLKELAFPLTTLLAGAGVLGVVIGLGAQNMVRDILAGFFIVLENQFGIGDVIRVGENRGRVVHMSLRVTQIRDLKGRFHTIPNGEIKSVINLSRGWAQALVDIKVAYQEDLDQVISVMEDEVTKLAQESKFKPLCLEKPIVLGVEELGESGITIRIIAKTIPLQQWDVQREIRKRIKTRFDRENITIPFPQRTVWQGNEGAQDKPN